MLSGGEENRPPTAQVTPIIIAGRRLMSFQDIYHGLKAGLRPPPPLQMVVSHSVFQINTCVATLWRLADALAGCRGDGRATRERIRRTRADAMRLAWNTAQKLGDAGDDVGPKLVADFEAALRDLQRVQQRVIAADRRETASASAAFLTPFFSPPAPSYDASPSRTQVQQCDIQTQRPLVQSRRTQDLVRLGNEVTFDEALVQEREQEICKIQREIAEINEIVRDLATLGHGQHEAIEIVECNLGAAATETAQAQVQLTKAAMTQGKKTRSVTECMVIAAVGLVVLALVLLNSM